jgi:uncharacterized RDD family membrane protein YckC
VGDPDEVFGRRIAAALLDLLVLAILFAVMSGGTGGGSAEDGRLSLELEGAAAAAWFGLVLAYYFVFEATIGATLGKRWLGLRVVRSDGGEPGVGAIALRTVLRVVDSLPILYLVGLVTMLVTGKRRQRLGDLAAKTTVVRV